MEWYIRFDTINTNNPKWLKARNHQIRYVENYIKYGINPSTDANTVFNVKMNDKSIYTTYINESGEIVEMLFDTPEQVACINRITDYLEC